MQITWSTEVYGSASISLTVHRTQTQIAPDPVYVEVTSMTGFDASTNGVYDARLHDIDFYWTIKDSGGNFLSDWTAPEKTFNGSEKAGYGQGFGMVRVLPKETWTFECFAHEKSSGKTAFASVDVAVTQDVFDYFDPANIYVVDSGVVPDFTGKPTGATEYTDATTALRAALGFNANDICILFKRGQTHEIDAGGGTWNSIRWEYGNGYIGAWGTGAKPVISPVGYTDGSATIALSAPNWEDSANPMDYRIVDVEFRGDWDTVNDPGVSTAPPVTPFKVLEGNANILFDNVTASGLAALVYSEADMSKPLNMVANNCDITEWQNFGIYMGSGFGDGVVTTNQRGYVAVLGCKIAQNPNADGGGPKTGNPWYNTHGPIRIPDATYIHVEGCDLFSCNSWEPTTLPQPCLRVHTALGSYGDSTGKSCVVRNVMEGGAEVLAYQESSAKPQRGSVTMNAVAQGNLLIGCWGTRNLVRTNYNGLTLKANLMIAPGDVDNSIQWTGCLVYEKSTGVEHSSISDGELLAYSNTIIALRDSANDDGNNVLAVSNNGTPTWTVENNIHHAPDLTGTGDEAPVTTYAPLDTSTIIVTPRTNGYRNDYYSIVENSARANPATLVATYEPQSGSAALLGYSTGKVSYRDIERAARPSGSEDIGAWQVSA